MKHDPRSGKGTPGTRLRVWCSPHRLALIALIALSSAVAIVPQQSIAAGAPSTAQALAHRLGIHTAPIVGNQPQGQGGPWTVWFPRFIRPAEVGLGNVNRVYLPMSGPALFTGPRGARGEFHYFNPAPLGYSAARTGRDRYHGPRLPAQRAVRIALQWLRTAGAPVPHGKRHVQLGSGGTDIGGTGLCCFNVLDIVHWGGSQDASGFVRDATGIVYIADAGTVVEADIGSLPDAHMDEFFYPCPGHTTRVANGIHLGVWCFHYAIAVRHLIVADIGNHSSWVTDPGMLADLGATYVTRGPARPSAVGPPRQILLTPRRAVYAQSYRGVRYRMTLVPAFPGLAGSVWELVRITRG